MSTGGDDDRARRLKAALRENLQRRKAAQRKAAGRDTEPAGAGEDGSDRRQV